MDILPPLQCKQPYLAASRPDARKLIKCTYEKMGGVLRWILEKLSAHAYLTYIPHMKAHVKEIEILS